MIKVSKQHTDVLGKYSLSEARRLCKSKNKSVLTKKPFDVNLFNLELIDDASSNASRIWTGSTRFNRIVDP